MHRLYVESFRVVMDEIPKKKSEFSALSNRADPELNRAWITINMHCHETTVFSGKILTTYQIFQTSSTFQGGTGTAKPIIYCDTQAASCK